MVFRKKKCGGLIICRIYDYFMYDIFVFAKYSLNLHKLDAL